MISLGAKHISGGLLVTLCLLAFGGSRTIEINADSPKVVVRKYFVAIDAGELETAQKYVPRDAANRLAAELNVRIWSATRVAMKAVADRFGNPVERPGKLPFNAVHYDPEMIEKSQEIINGDSARVLIPIDKESISLSLRRIDGLWKLDLDSVLRMPADKVEFVNGIHEILNTIDSAAKQGAADVKAGKYATTTAAVNGVNQTIDDATRQKILEIGARLKKN
jgi:hypothetical protein